MVWLGACVAAAALATSAHGSPPARPTKAALPQTASDIVLKGWTPDSARFVVTTYRGYDMGQLGGVDYLRIHEVRDASTGALVDAYKVARVNSDPDDSDSARAWSAAHAAARPAKQWRPFKASLVPGRRGLSAKAGAWKVRAELVKQPGAKGLRGVRTKLRTKGQHIALRLAVPKRPEPLPDAQVASPSIRIFLTDGSKESEIAVVSIPSSFMTDSCGTSDATESKGGIGVRWSPDESRIFVQIWLEQDEVYEECPGASWSTYWIHALSPVSQ